MNMFADFLEEMSGKGLGAVIGLLLGGLIAWLIGRWRRRHLRYKVLRGDARDTVVIHHHLVETVAAPEAPPGRRPRLDAHEPGPALQNGASTHGRAAPVGSTHQVRGDHVCAGPGPGSPLGPVGNERGPLGSFRKCADPAKLGMRPCSPFTLHS